jgi:glucose-fructose oxidoreductase
MEATEPTTPDAGARRRVRRKPIRFAVVGLGHIAQAAVLPAFAHARSRASLHAIISGSPEKLVELGEKYQVPVRGGYDELEHCLAECHAVYIAAPNSRHAEFAIRAAHLGVHVLCEKPLAVTDAECRRMIGACRDARVKLMTAYRLHFEPLTIEALQLIRSGRIGEPRFFSADFSMTVKPGNIRTRAELGGGTLYDLGVYCINGARMMFGDEPTRVSAFSVDGARAGFPEVDEMTSALLHFKDDRLATFTTSFGAADASSFRVVGTEGDLFMQPAFEYAQALEYTLTSGEKTTKKRGRKRDQFAAELIYFADCINEDRDPEPSGEEGAWDVRIVDALYEAARRGEQIALRPVAPDPGPNRDQAIDRPAVGEVSLVNVESAHE